MKRIAHRLLLVALPTLALLQAGCNRDDPKRLSAVGQQIRAKATTVMSKTNDRLTLHWQKGSADGGPSLEERVHERLLWDHELEGLEIDVKVKGTLVELHGTVVNPGQRQRAVDLAQSTLGVEKVIQHLVVSGPHSE